MPRGETMSEELLIRNMSRGEVDELVDWAANEGWNPGLGDAEVFWRTDRDAFIAAETEGELIGGGAITAYGGAFGFMGFFIVKPEHRSKGLGNTLWHARRERLLGRLDSGATIGLDGVFTMQDYYARGGFVYSHRNLRYCAEVPQRGSAAAGGSGPVMPLEEVPFDEVLAYDRSCFPASRPGFLQDWAGQSTALALAYRQGDTLQGFGVIRRCREGCKLGPLFADNAEVANALYEQLAVFAAGGPLFLDAPENNPAAMDLVARHNMSEVFGCARMYIGPFPELRHERIFGVTTFELG